ncbi:UNVERIFIED_CONTAM: putative late blight resistance proteinR1A-10 [Sesamum latifolium]|uniref:Late blight resistance proteinR1A-10 n=1 Tax=Sesamum latifolium TaxID=2727402 RepID=A0AAW2UXX7_9LAMI
MTIIGSLPNLEVLKLLGNSFRGPEWRSIEGEFCQLKFLVLAYLDVVQWRADDTHFPRLQNLTIRSCYKLEEIPSCIGDISTLQLIELDDCAPSAMTSAKQIQEEQQFLGNYDLHLFEPRTEMAEDMTRFFNMAIHFCSWLWCKTSRAGSISRVELELFNVLRPSSNISISFFLILVVDIVRYTKKRTDAGAERERNERTEQICPIESSV